ncbi:MAG TPA: glycosyltransferase, partial [Beijerinckiaceae bacterium]
SETVRAYLKDLEFSLGVEKPKSDFLFLPTESFEEVPERRGSRWELAHWIAEGDDHPAPDLLAALEAAHLIGSQGGLPLPEGSDRHRMREHGVALCLHTDEHRDADLPSGRLFEAAAAGAVIVTDELPFARRVLGDAALFVDSKASRADVVDQVRKHLLWLNEDPARGERLVAEARAILQGRLDIETMVAQCCAFATAVLEDAQRSRHDAIRALQKAEPVVLRQASQSSARAAAHLSERPLVDVVVRAGERPPEVVKRALRSIARQSGGTYRAILVDYKGSEELKAFAEGFRARNMTVTYVRSPDTGYRSTALWAGLARIEAPFFAVLDDDDSVAPDHFPSLIELASRHPADGFFYGGTIRVEDDGAVSPPPNFMGPLNLEFSERRQLQFLEPHDPSRLVAFDNYITSNSFIARRELLDETVLADPELAVAEDVYLYLLLAARTEFRSTFRPTALWHWRSAARDNSMLAVAGDKWRRTASKISLRLAHVRLPAAMPLSKLRGDSPFVLQLGTLTGFNADVVARSESGFLNPGEPDGVWTSATRSFIRLPLSDFVQDGRIVLEFAASGAPRKPPQSVRISVDDQPVYSGPARAWDRMRVEKPLKFARSRNVVVLRVECDVTFNPLRAGEASIDERDLGVFLAKVLIDRTEPKTVNRAAEWARAMASFVRARLPALPA